MLRLKRIVCPTDFSEGSRSAMSVATQIALQTEAEVLLVSVIAIQPAIVTDPNYAFVVPEYEQTLRSEAEQRLAEVAHEMEEAGVRSRTLIAHGDAAGEIVRIAEQQQADLIVIATFGKTGWRRLAFGSVTERIVRLASCPVLTIRADVTDAVHQEHSQNPAA